MDSLDDQGCPRSPGAAADFGFANWCYELGGDTPPAEAALLALAAAYARFLAAPEGRDRLAAAQRGKSLQTLLRTEADFDAPWLRVA